jgi:hypothetical protein
MRACREEKNLGYTEVRLTPKLTASNKVVRSSCYGVHERLKNVDIV